MSFRDPNEDLFEDSRMSFGEHLEELRLVLVRAAIGVGIGCIFGFLFANQVVGLLTSPLEDAMEVFRVNEAQLWLTEKYGYVPPEYRPLMAEGKVPRHYQVDPAQILNVIKSASPDFSEKIQLNPYAFRAEHLKPGRLGSLASRLVERDAEANSAQLEVIWDQVSSVDRATLQRLSAIDGEATERQQTELLEVLNRIADSDQLHREAAFDAQLVKSEPGWLQLLFQQKVEQPLADLKTTLDSPDISEDTRLDLRHRLNRALLASLFPEELEVARLDVMPIEIWEDTDFSPQALGVTESFFVWLKAGLFSGLTLAGPWVFYQLWAFVAAGLYPHEKRQIHVFLPISIALFVAGVLLAFFFVFQPVLGFLFSFNQSLGIAPQMRIGDWISFALFLPLGFGVAFQLPLVMLFVNRIGLVEVQTYLDKWRIAVMIIFVLAMFLTPADPISLLLLAVPLTLLYFLGIAMCKWLPRNQNPYGADAGQVAGTQ